MTATKIELPYQKFRRQVDEELAAIRLGPSTGGEAFGLGAGLSPGAAAWAIWKHRHFILKMHTNPPNWTGPLADRFPRAVKIVPEFPSRDTNDSR